MFFEVDFKLFLHTLRMKCGSCQNSIARRGENSFDCAKCHQQYHQKCTSISENTLKSMTAEMKASWKCKCSETSSEDTHLKMKDVVENDIQNMLDKYMTKIDHRFQEYEKNLQFLMQKMQEMAVRMNVMDAKIQMLEKEQEEKRNENSELRNKFRHLEIIVQDLSQESLGQKIEISGLPTGESVSVENVNRLLVEKLGTEGTKVVDVSLIRRYNKTSVVASFESKLIRNLVLNKIRKDRIRWKIGDLRKDGDTRSLFINEYLND